MNYESALQRAVLVRRYQRVLADVTRPDGTALSIPCPTTGLMPHGAELRRVIMLNQCGQPKRKDPRTFEQAQAVPALASDLATQETVGVG